MFGKACENFIVRRSILVYVLYFFEGWNEWYDEFSVESGGDVVLKIDYCCFFEDVEFDVIVVGDEIFVYVISLFVIFFGSNKIFVDLDVVLLYDVV